MSSRESKLLCLLTNFYCVEQPSPGEYDVISDFDIGGKQMHKRAGSYLSKKYVYSFGLPYSYYKKVYNPDNPTRVENESLTPGPGQYHDKTKMIGTNGIRIGMKPRIKNQHGKLSTVI